MTAEMGIFLEGLLPGVSSREDKDFTPVARYYPAMDILLYLKEDCSYRADRLGIFLTVLWHPTEDRLVGIKLKGCKFLFHHLKRMVDVQDDEFIPLIRLLELAFVGGVGDALMRKVRDDRLREKYERAREVAAGYDLPPKEWKRVPPEEEVRRAA